MDEASTNYFTVVEEHFQRARGTGMFLLSPRDLTLVEAWRASGVPLEAVLRGVDAVFEKRRSATERVNSLPYCAQAGRKEPHGMAHTRPIGRSNLPFHIPQVAPLY